MLAYAPDRRTVGAGQNARKTLMLVVAGHALLVGVALTTKMTIDLARSEGPLIVDSYPAPKPPPPEPKPQLDPRTDAHLVSRIDKPDPVIPLDIPLNRDPVEVGPAGPTDVAIGPKVDQLPQFVIDPPHPAVKMGAILRTTEADLRPPYPLDKLRAEEEATLRLKLTIDEKGRVVAVDAVGAADPSFLSAARRHLLRSWRYKPATVDGVPTPTTMIISLSFRLEDA